MRSPSERSLGVSCLCLTYGRPRLLEESIESFLRQDWSGGPKELVVVNDHPEQTLVFDHPEVVIVNLPRRLRTIGEKRNLSAALASFDNLLVWDDDDIYLPWRLQETMRRLPQDHYFKCPQAWCITGNLFHGGVAYTRWLFESVGGYGFHNGGEDAAIENRFEQLGPEPGRYRRHTTLSRDRLYYVYRWGHGQYHATGCSDLGQIQPSVTPGVHHLSPYWHSDYEAIARAHAAS
jgi:glycosyltransferase involved in cell wall biosynthesis